MFRRTSSSSSTSEWCELRKSTAWRLSITPASRASSTRSTTYRACAASSRTVTYLGFLGSWGFSPPPRGGVARGGGGGVRPQLFAIPRRALAHQRIGGVEHRLRRSVVLLQPYHRGAVLALEGEDVLHRRRAERVDRLRVVADHRQPLARRAQRLQDLGLDEVRVLVLVHQDVGEARADLPGERGVLHHRVPVEEQVVVVERLARELALDVGGEEPVQCGLPFGGPGGGGLGG